MKYLGRVTTSIQIEKGRAGKRGVACKPALGKESREHMAVLLCVKEGQVNSSTALFDEER